MHESIKVKVLAGGFEMPRSSPIPVVRSNGGSLALTYTDKPTMMPNSLKGGVAETPSGLAKGAVTGIAHVR
jgi:hypothetical protein